MSDNDAGERPPPIWTGHIVAYCSDPQEASGFYISIGMRPVAVMDEFAVLEMAGGTHLALRRDPDRAGVVVGFDLMVDDLHATHAAWAEAGHEVSEITSDPIHERFFVRDHDGNTIEVCNSHVVGPV